MHVNVCNKPGANTTIIGMDFRIPSGSRVFRMSAIRLLLSSRTKRVAMIPFCLASSLSAPCWFTRIRRQFLPGGLLLILGAALLGCSAPSISQQRLVSKPDMTFSDAAAFSYIPSRLFPQLATGTAATGGTQNSGCTSCR